MSPITEFFNQLGNKNSLKSPMSSYKIDFGDCEFSVVQRGYKDMLTAIQSYVRVSIRNN